MAVAAAMPISLPFPALLPTRSFPHQQRRALHSRRQPRALLARLSARQGPLFRRRGLPDLTAVRASSDQEEGADGGEVPEGGAGASDAGGENTEAAEAAEATARRMVSERGEGGGGDLLWGGVAEEVREIEWPAFGKVVGTTGVVLAVIAGSSVALLTVNAVLAELSDRFFAGRGVQDFFSG